MQNAKHMMIALAEARHQEITGKEDNPEILKYFNDLGYDGSKLKDETSWCAAFVNWVLKQADLPYTGKLNARSFLKIGKPTDKPEVGDIVVFWRGSKSSWMGHVGFYLRESNNYIYVLGGNQSNQVKMSGYAKNRLLGFRKIV